MAGIVIRPVDGVQAGHRAVQRCLSHHIAADNRRLVLLRLLSNRAIMGDDAVDRSQVWRTFDQLWADERVLWADEPDELAAVWRAISAPDDKSHKLWTDDYLAAFAQASDATLATLTRHTLRVRGRMGASRQHRDMDL